MDFDWLDRNVRPVRMGFVTSRPRRRKPHKEPIMAAKKKIDPKDKPDPKKASPKMKGKKKPC